MHEAHTIYVCDHGHVYSAFGRRLPETPVCYRCADWPDMEPREIREPSPLLVSDEVPSRLRPLAFLMRTNGEARTR